MKPYVCVVGAVNLDICGRPEKKLIFRDSNPGAVTLTPGGNHLMLMDLTGRIRRTLHRPYSFPAPSELMAFASSGLAQLTADLTPQQRSGICGVGIAAPFELWNWEEVVGAPHAVVDAWRGFDLHREIVNHPDFKENRIHTRWLEQVLLPARERNAA